MRGFRQRAEVADVLALLDRRVSPLPDEDVALAEAAGRVLAEAVTAPLDSPRFARSAMDGYAVRGEDTFGAGPYAPIVLRVVGTALPGRAPTARVGAGEAVRIMTGAPLPDGADAVLMAEDARPQRERADDERVEATAAVPPGKNVSRRGEDIRSGEILLPAGRALRPQDLGVLASVGVGAVRAHRRPRVDLFVTGDELLPAGARPEGHAIVDANSPMLAALVARDGATLAGRAMLRDDPAIVRAALAGSDGDAVLIAGGSSVGIEDHVPRIVAELGELPVHGIAMRPSSPAGIGFIGARPVFLLPGNPVSCLCAYDFFAGPSLRRLGGRPFAMPYRRVALPLARKLTSQSGRVDYARVRVVEGRVEPLAVSGASILSSTTRADGFVIVERDREGYDEGTVVEVHLYDG